MASPNQGQSQGQGNKLSNAVSNMLDLPEVKKGVFEKYSGFMQALTSATKQVDEITEMAGTLSNALEKALHSNNPGFIGGAEAMKAALAARSTGAQTSPPQRGPGSPVPVQLIGGPLRVIIVGNEASSWIDALKPVGFAASIGAFAGNLVGGVVGAFVNPFAYIKMFESGTGLLKSLERLMPQFSSFMDGPLSSIFDKLLTGAQYIQEFLDSVMRYMGWIITGFGNGGWITQSILGFFDAALLWATSRVKALLGWAAQTLHVINRWLFPTISVLIENLFNTVMDTIITTVVSRLLNVISRVLGEVWGAIRGWQFALSAFGSWLGGLFSNIMAKIHNAIADGVNAVAGPLNVLLAAMSLVQRTPLIQIPLMQQKAVPQVANLNFVDEMTRGHTQGLNEASQILPWNWNNKSIQKTFLQSYLPSTPLQDTPPMGKLPAVSLPDFELPGAKKPGQGDGTGSGCCGVTVQGGIHVTVQAGAVSADNLNALARELADRMMEELERVGNMRLSRRGRPQLAPQ